MCTSLSLSSIYPFIYIYIYFCIYLYKIPCIHSDNSNYNSLLQGSFWPLASPYLYLLFLMVRNMLPLFSIYLLICSYFCIKSNYDAANCLLCLPPHFNSPHRLLGPTGFSGLCILKEKDVKGSMNCF